MVNLDMTPNLQRSLNFSKANTSINLKSIFAMNRTFRCSLNNAVGELDNRRKHIRRRDQRREVCLKPLTLFGVR